MTDGAGAVAEPGISIADGIEYPLDPRWITLARRRNALRLLTTTPVWVVVVGIALFATSLDPWIDRLIWILLAVKVITGSVKAYVWPPVQYRHASYMVDAQGICVRGGVWHRSTTSVPRSRVQHIDVSQSFGERRLGLASLIIHTAARGNSEVGLPGVDLAIATRIRDYLLPQDEGDAV